MGRVVLAVAPDAGTLAAANGSIKGRGGAAGAAGRKTKAGKGQQGGIGGSDVTPESAAARWAGLSAAGYAQLLVASKVLARSASSYGRALRHGAK